MRLISRLHLSEGSMYGPEGVANPRTPNVGPTCFRSERGDKARPVPRTNWEVVAGKRMRFERCAMREMMRALAAAEFREGIIGLEGQGRVCLGPSAVKYFKCSVSRSSGSEDVLGQVSV